MVDYYPIVRNLESHLRPWLFMNKGATAGEFEHEANKFLEEEYPEEDWSTSVMVVENELVGHYYSVKLIPPPAFIKFDVKI